MADYTDMSNMFRFFRIPTPLYDDIADYALIKNYSITVAMATLLHKVRNKKVPPYATFEFIDIAKDQYRVQPQMYKSGYIKQFNLRYPVILQKEIYDIFKQTGYKNQTIEMNKEICARLAYALELKRDREVNTSQSLFNL